MQKQITKSASIILDASIEKVYPLFTPLGEVNWVRGWKPEFVYPENGEFKENLVFKTKSNNDVESEFNWIVSSINKVEHKVTYTAFTENRVWTVKVVCKFQSETKTIANVEYVYTALNEVGEGLNIEAAEMMFKKELTDWEDSFNYYLDTGGFL